MKQSTFNRIISTNTFIDLAYHVLNKHEDVEFVDNHFDFYDYDEVFTYKGYIIKIYANPFFVDVLYINRKFDVCIEFHGNKIPLESNYNLNGYKNLLDDYNKDDAYCVICVELND